MRNNILVRFASKCLKYFLYYCFIIQLQIVFAMIDFSLVYVCCCTRRERKAPPTVTVTTLPTQVPAVGVQAKASKPPTRPYMPRLNLLKLVSREPSSVDESTDVITFTDEELDKSLYPLAADFLVVEAFGILNTHYFLYKHKEQKRFHPTPFKLPEIKAIAPNP